MDFSSRTTSSLQRSLPSGLAAIALSCQVAMGASPREVAFDDLAPAGLTLEQCWDAIGMDSQQRVYIGFTSKWPDGREDFAVFRYDPSTDERRYLGSFMTASTAAANLKPGEQIPKGHTHLLEAGGRMYMGSQGFHDLKGPLDTLPNYRGSHLYAYDIARGTLEDASRSLPDGVLTRHEGIIALAHAPGSDLLVGLAHPSSGIVLFDTTEGRVTQIVPGIPWRLGNPLSREVVATKTGKIYSYRGTEDPAQRDEVHDIWAYDVRSGESSKTAYSATGGFWNGQTLSRDGNTIYLATVNGELYRLDVASGVFTHLGAFLPKAELAAGEQVSTLYGITLSADEKRIFGIPRRTRSSGSNLYAYEIATGVVSLAGPVEPGVYTGSDVRDARGNLYFARFGDDQAWQGKTRLAVLHP
jgi:outer membrane protein assembly factor BamB